MYFAMIGADAMLQDVREHIRTLEMALSGASLVELTEDHGRALVDAWQVLDKHLSSEDADFPAAWGATMSEQLETETSRADAAEAKVEELEGRLVDVKAELESLRTSIESALADLAKTQ